MSDSPARQSHQRFPLFMPHKPLSSLLRPIHLIHRRSCVDYETYSWCRCHRLRRSVSLRHWRFSQIYLARLAGFRRPIVYSGESLLITIDYWSRSLFSRIESTDGKTVVVRLSGIADRSRCFSRVFCARLGTQKTSSRAPPVWARSFSSYVNKAAADGRD